MKSTRVTFSNADGKKLTGRIDLPLDHDPQRYALFAHCFTCGKDLKVERNISLSLTQKGFGVLRFDFTGLGQSEGDFSDTNFSSNVQDLHAAAAFMRDNYHEPELLIGHSLGGTAALMAGSEMKLVKAIASIAAPCEPQHVLNLLGEDLEEIEREEQATIKLAGRKFIIKSQFIKDLQNHGMKKILQSETMRGKSLLIMHSPQDEIVEIQNARHIYDSAFHPKSFISLDGADHLVSDERDSLYAGEVIAAWAQRYIDSEKQPSEKSEEQVLARLNKGPFLTEILAGTHHMIADEPKEQGGSNLGPTPYEFLAAGLGACTAMTLKLYAERKKWDLEEVKVHLNYDGKYREDCEHCEDEERKLGRFERIVELEGKLDEKQRKRLIEIANKCPVHKTLSIGVDIETTSKD